MPDTVPPKTRSRIMASVRTKHTGPELALRSYLQARGLRFRLHDKRLPGTPDIVFPSAKLAVQVRGCFWHSHGCRLSKAPTSRTEYWIPKLLENRRRDVRQDRQLRKKGWSVLIVWQCSISTSDGLAGQVRRVSAALARRTQTPGIKRKRERSGGHVARRHGSASARIRAFMSANTRAAG